MGGSWCRSVRGSVGIPTLTVFGSTDVLRYHAWGQHVDWLCEPEGRLEALSGAAVAARGTFNSNGFRVDGERITDHGV